MEEGGREMGETSFSNGWRCKRVGDDGERREMGGLEEGERWGGLLLVI